MQTAKLQPYLWCSCVVKEPIGIQEGTRRADVSLGAKLRRLPDGEVNGFRHVLVEVKNLPQIAFG